jgi:hypothetical protein
MSSFITCQLDPFSDNLDFSFTENNNQSNISNILDICNNNEENINSLYSTDNILNVIQAIEDSKDSFPDFINPEEKPLFKFREITKTTKKKILKYESNLFNITRTEKKRNGRKPGKIRQKFHDSSTDDNCLLKIQNNFFNFIVNLANEVLIKENINLDFKLVDYKIKSNVNHDFFCWLKKMSIKNILSMDISPKYRSKKKDYNREVLYQIYNYSNWLNDFFNINYLDLFYEYHNNEKPLLKFVFKGKEIKISKAKSFYYLLNNKNNKDKKIVKDLSNIAKRFFINDNSTFNKILFQTKETIDLKE